MPTPIALAELRALIVGGAQLVEVLPEEEFAEAHLPGAVNIPLKLFTSQAVASLDRHRAVVAYCWDGL